MIKNTKDTNKKEKKNPKIIMGFAYEPVKGEFHKAGELQVFLDSRTTTIIITNPTDISWGKGFKVTPEETNQIKSIYKQLIAYRGAIINRAIDIEKQLDQILSLLVIIPNKEDLLTTDTNTLSKNSYIKNWNRERLQEHVFSRNLLSFMDKFKILQSLSEKSEQGEHHPLLKKMPPGMMRNIRKNVHDVINIRNKFAHGHIVFYGIHPKLIYVKNGIKKEPLSLESMDAAVKNFDVVHQDLRSLHHLVYEAANLESDQQFKGDPTETN